MAFYVYITASSDRKHIYIGHTDMLARRTYEHKFRILSGWSSTHGCTQLVWYDEFTTRDEAKNRERQMKKWNRAWKIELIEAINPDWNDLYNQLNA